MSAARIDRVMGLDLSLTCTGVAVLWDDQRLDLDTATTPPSGSGLHSRHGRIAYLTEQAISIEGDPHTLAVVENPAYSRTQGSNTDRMGLWWDVVGKLLDRECHVATVTPSALKKWVTGTGNADKAAVAAVIARLCPDADITSSDVADAAALALMGAHRLGWRADLDNGYRADVLGKVDWPEGINA